jgi:hypothetical protein
MEWLGEVKSMSSLEIYLYGLCTCKNFTHAIYIKPRTFFLICSVTNLNAHNKNIHANMLHKYTYKKVYIRAAWLQTIETMYFSTPTQAFVLQWSILGSISMKIRIGSSMFKNIFKSNIGRLLMNLNRDLEFLIVLNMFWSDGYIFIFEESLVVNCFKAGTRRVI